MILNFFLLQLMRLDGSIDTLNMSRSESVSELNSELLNGSTLLRPRTSFGKDPDATPTKPFGLGMLIYLFYFLFMNIY